jgi:hypothetical protein
LAPLIKGAFAGPNSRRNGYQSSGEIPKVRPVLRPSKFPTNLLKPPSPEEKGLSIFKKPILAASGLTRTKSGNLTYNGFGGTSKILPSEEKAEARRLKPF